MPILFPLAGRTRGSAKPGIPGIIPGRLPPPAAPGIFISGITKNSIGQALGNCVVRLFRTVNDAIVEEVVSDDSGNYSFSIVGLGQTYYVVAYKAGSPDVSGTTVNTLQGT